MGDPEQETEHNLNDFLDSAVNRICLLESKFNYKVGLLREPRLNYREQVLTCLFFVENWQAVGQKDQLEFCHGQWMLLGSNHFAGEGGGGELPDCSVMWK